MSSSPDFPNPDAFQDPLENYEPKEYADPLEEALAEKTVAMMQATPFVSVPPETTVEQAVRQLSERRVGCLLVAEGSHLVGLFTERDALNRVALEWEAMCDRPVAEVMRRQPVYVYDTDSVAAALSVMAVCGYRHVPVLNVDDQLIGILSPQRVTDFLADQMP